MIAATCAFLILAASPLWAASTIRVPADHPTIQGAITAASNGDTVLVSPGTYVENINFLGKAITVTSEAGADVTIIDGNLVGSVVTFDSGEGPASVLSGFSIQNGNGRTLDHGGGIQVFSSPTIANNRIINNFGCHGAGMQIRNGSPIVRNNEIAHNDGTGCRSIIEGGGGIFILGDSNAQILDNVISNNVTSRNGGGIRLSLSTAGTGIPLVRGNVIANNRGVNGAGIVIGGSAEANIVQNLIYGNNTNYPRAGGGIAWSVTAGYRGPLVVNNTIADNSDWAIFAAGFDANSALINNVIVARLGHKAIYCGAYNDPDPFPPVIAYNDVYAPHTKTAYGGICHDQTGLNGNISADPAFVAPFAQDFRLKIGSPATDAGTNSAPLLPTADLGGDARISDDDGDGIAVVDMGAYEGPRVVGDGLAMADVVVDFGPAMGLWRWMNDSEWVKLHEQSPEVLATGDLDDNGQADVVIGFAPALGTWKWMNNADWVRLHVLSPEVLATGDLDGNGIYDVVIDFGATTGLWRWMNDSEWVKLQNLPAQLLAIGDLDGNGADDVVVDFGATIGLWRWMNDSQWVKLHTLSPEVMATGDLDGNGLADAVIGFAPELGTWKWMNNSEWIKLHNLPVELLATGDLDGNGADDVVVDFGATIGLWRWMNDSEWVKLHWRSPEFMVTGDLDGNGSDDVVIDFGATVGLWKWMNNSSWLKLHGVSPEVMGTGNLDGL
ncbi:MAG: right-handed parallel beta-helix repeat-containing protein [Rhodospirillales bacterium]|nr:right-handed parallel beta-helix repeat-containing protein [Rhodospirillales bacterium]MDH3968608.1 right-handed parallel beta-helix repeat-containing protein [Rhodospirillales bacterium]